MEQNPKYIRFWTLALLQVVIVGNLQVLPANAIYGLSLPFLYVLAAIGFFIPCALMTARLATRYPQTGGAYIWCEHAFGPKLGFFTVAILWISNLLWYPSIFALISTNLVYVFNPELASNTLLIVAISLAFFWIITGLNCAGIEISTKVSIVCSVIGIIMPMLLIIGCALYWWAAGHPIELSLGKTPWIPDLSNFSHWNYLIAIIISLFGLEVAAVHSGNVSNPKRNFPLSLWISSILILVLLLGSELGIGAIIPSEKLSVMTGLLDALKAFLDRLNLSYLIAIILFVVFLGNVGSTMAWMLGSTRGMFVACQDNHVGKFLQKTNRFEAPVGVLISEAFVFTLVCGIFLMFPKITDTFWLLLDLASEITLIYYIILFSAALRLLSFKISMILGILTCIIALIAGFIPPADLSEHNQGLFRVVMGLGLILALAVPFILLNLNRR